jgi:penicillin-binding protein 1A
VIRLASSLGMRDLPDVPSLALGTGVVSPLDLTAGFAVFPNGGFAVHPRGITTVLDADDLVAFANPATRTRVISPQTAFQMVTMLEDVLDRGTGSAARALGVRFPSGGKTGTTDDYKDAWFVGFSPSLVVGVWVGYDQPATIGSRAYGGRLALPIWADFMRRAARRVPPGRFDQPDGLRRDLLCRVSYQAPVEGCPTYLEYFKYGDDVPSSLCTLHEASFGERAERAFEQLFRWLGRRARGVIR